MSINSANFEDGIIIHKGEWILLYGENVKIEFYGNDMSIFGRRKSGNLFLTTHRLIFQNKNKNDLFKSFNMPLILINNLSVDNEIMQTYIITGKVRAEENQNWNGIVTVKIFFDLPKNTFEFGEAIQKCIELLAEYPCQERSIENIELPITPRQSTIQMHSLPLSTLEWLPKQFTDLPSPNVIFVVSFPLPYPGLCYIPEGSNAPPSTPTTQSINDLNDISNDLNLNRPIQILYPENESNTNSNSEQTHQIQLKLTDSDQKDTVTSRNMKKPKKRTKRKFKPFDVTAQTTKYSKKDQN